MKNAIEILIWIALNLLIAFNIALGSVVILTILPINEHNVSFHLLVSSSISFMSVLGFLNTGLLPPWLNLILAIFLWDYKKFNFSF